MRTLRITGVAVLVGFTAAVAAPALAAPPVYFVTDLGTLGGANSYGWAINNAGQVVGESSIQDVVDEFDEDFRHAFLYADNVMHDLGTLGGQNSVANDINEVGQIAGTSDTFDFRSAFLYSEGVMEDIGNLGGTIPTSDGHGLNDAGEVTGGSWSPVSAHEAFLYSGGSMQRIGLVPGPCSFQSHGYDVNNLGQVSGEATTPVPDTNFCTVTAFLYSDGEMLLIGDLLPDFSTQGYAINDLGQVVIFGIPRLGSGQRASGFLYTDDRMEEIGPDLIPWGINNSGWVVGQTTLGGEDARAFLYIDGATFNLNDLVADLSGWVYLESAQDINDSGQITGYGRTATGETHAFLLTPLSNVSIDIKPGTINPFSRGKITVAVLSTESFDAPQVDWVTVLFGPDGATESHGRSHVEDVDRDGDMDLVLHFDTQDTGIQCGHTEARLTGETFDGQSFTGSDAIKTVKCR